MTEGTQTTEPVVAEPQDIGLAQYIGADGTFKDGWKDNLLPEEIRSEKIWDRFGNIQEVFKSESEAQKLVAKKGLIPPTDKSTPEEWNSFYKALGRPDKPEEYGLKRPEEIPEKMWDDELLNSATKAFHEMGVPTPQAKKLFDWYNQRTLDTIKDIQKEQEEAERIIRGEAGNKYDEIDHDGHRLMQDNLEGLPEPIKAGILQEINDPKAKPYLFFLLANIQKHFDEHTTLQGGELPGAKGVQQKIDEEMKKDSYKNRDDIGHQRQVNYVQSLFAEKAKLEGKI